MRKRATIIIMIVLLAAINTGLEVSDFNGAEPEISLVFENEFTSNPFSISVPQGTVSEARMTIKGFDSSGSGIQPADIILVTDVSGSMDDDCVDVSNPDLTPCKINDAKAAANSFLDNTNLQRMHVGLVDYSTCPKESLNLIQLTDNEADLRDRIDRYEAGSFTNIGGGLEIAYRELLSVRARPGSSKVIILLTDGLANRYYPSGYCAACSCSSGETPAKQYVRNVADNAEAAGMIIYGIAFGNDADTSLMQEITTNGVSYFAPDRATLQSIYDEIARSISLQDFPTPEISVTAPVPTAAWSYPSQYSQVSIWDADQCGNSQATCSDFIDLVQQNLDACVADPCDLQFSVYSETVGTLNLSDLYIEINEPPFVNPPPTGICAREQLLCGDEEFRINLDDGRFVSDPNDELSTLDWKLTGSLESPGGAWYSHNTDYNLTRVFTGAIDPAHLNDQFWKTYYFTVSDPWGQSTQTCVNVTYPSCEEPMIDIEDATVTFDISSYPGHEYDLKEMIVTMPDECTYDELEYYVNASVNFDFIGPDSNGILTIIPSDPDWYNPTEDAVNVQISCPDAGARAGYSTQRYGNADVILITDWSGSMKKSVSDPDWGQGTGVTDCQTIYASGDARKTHLARCLDEEFIRIVMNYSDNRIWPVFFYGQEGDDILSYTGDPTNMIDVIDFIYDGTPQGRDKTCISCAINEGNDILSAESNDERKKFFVVMTDGVPTHCSEGSCVSELTPYGTKYCEGFCDTNGANGCGTLDGCNDLLCALPEANTLTSTSRSVSDLDATMYTIAFGLVEDCTRAEYLLGTIADLGGGEYRHSRNPQTLLEIYQDIAYQITTVSEVRNRSVSPYIVTDNATLTIRYVAPSPRCGDGSRNDPREECDDGNTNEYDECSNICTETFCGDARQQTPNGKGVGGLNPPNDGTEQCDDANLVDGDACSNTCVAHYCGDYYVQPILGEECDYGLNPETCTTDCHLLGFPGCGNGAIEAGEECDDGNIINDDGCSSQCLIEGNPGCGNSVIEPGEQCDDGCLLGIPNVCEPIDDTDLCDSQCRNVDQFIDIRDTTVSFGYTGNYPQGHPYELIDMIPVGSYGALPCEETDLRFKFETVPTQYSTQTITGYQGATNFTPINWYASTSEVLIVNASCGWDAEKSNTAELTVIYTAEGAPEGKLICKDPSGASHRYLLRMGETLELDLYNDLFDVEGDPGNIIDVTATSSSWLTITKNIPQLTFSPTDRGSGSFNIVAKTNTDFYSDSCPLYFYSPWSECDRPECKECTEISCLAERGCLPGETPFVTVYNPFTPLNVRSLMPLGTPPFRVTDFVTFDGFEVSPTSGPEATTFQMTAQSYVNHTEKNGSIITLAFPGYTDIYDTQNPQSSFCAILQRHFFQIGIQSYDPNSTLLVTGARSVPGFYEYNGYIFSKGPYIFIAKVWFR